MKSITLSILILLTFVVNAQTIEKYPTSSTNPIGYWLQVPVTHPSKPPAIIDLHGVGGRGPGTETTLESLIYGAPPPYAETPKDLQEGSNRNGILLIAPQIGGDWSVKNVNDFIDILIAKHNADPARIFLSGFSLGGGGVTRFITSTSSKRIKAAISTGGLNWGTDWTQATIPVWFFHCADDTRVPVSNTNNAVASMRAVGLNPKVTIFPSGGHSYGTAYSSQETYNWLLGTVTAPPTTPPPVVIGDPSFYLSDTTVIGTTAILEVKNPLNISTVYNAYQWTIFPKVGGSWSVNFSNGVYGPRKTIINLTPGTYSITCKALGTNGKLLQKDIVLTVTTGTVPAPVTEKKTVIVLADGTQWPVTYVLVNGYWQIKE